jgi:hypothetical protein
MKKICSTCKDKMKCLCKLDGSRMKHSKCGICKKLFCHYCLCAAETKFFSKNCSARTMFDPPICHKCRSKEWCKK